MLKRTLSLSRRNSGIDNSFIFHAHLGEADIKPKVEGPAQDLSPEVCRLQLSIGQSVPPTRFTKETLD